jgi:hypothetical protein
MTADSKRKKLTLFYPMRLSDLHFQAKKAQTISRHSSFKARISLAVNLFLCLLQEAKVPTLDRRPGRPAFHHQGPPTAPQAYIAAAAADERTPKGPPSPLAAVAGGLDSQLMPPGLRDPILRQGLVDMLSRRQGVDAGNGGGGLLQSMLSLAAGGGLRQGARMTAQQQQQQQQQQLLMEEAAAAMKPSDSLQAPGRRRFRGGGPSAMKYQQVRVDLTCQSWNS